HRIITVSDNNDDPAQPASVDDSWTVFQHRYGPVDALEELRGAAGPPYLVKRLGDLPRIAGEVLQHPNLIIKRQDRKHRVAADEFHKAFGGFALFCNLFGLDASGYVQGKHGGQGPAELGLFVCLEEVQLLGLAVLV